MRSIICVVVMFALIGLAGCAKNDAAPADQPEPQTETEVIATEDFESGEADIIVKETEEAVEETPVADDSESTP